MWLSFWRSRNRFSLEELRYLTDQLQKVQIVNEVNKDFVVEALRSIAELMTYGDQHDSSFFEFFMEKEVMGQLVRVLKISRTISVSLQLLQTMSIMIQNLKNEHAIYYLFSNEHMNYLITYSFDFRNEELLSHYISFLRAISGKLDKDTISLLVKTQKDEVEAFPLYAEAVKFAFHEESMIRIAVRTLTLNVYHVGDEGVNRYVTRGPLANYFKDFVTFLQKQCSGLNMLVFQASKDPNEEFSSGIIAAVDEIEDNLYYISDVVSAGIPDVGRLIADNLLQLLILPLLLPSLTNEALNEKHIGAITAMYLLCCILRIVKIKDLANTIAAAFFFQREAFVPNSEAIQNGDVICSKLHHLFGEGNHDQHMILDSGQMKVDLPDDASSQSSYVSSNSALREVLLSYLTSGNHAQVLGSLNVLATLSQTKELDETMLDAFGILPQRKQQKKLLLQALVGESSGEEQLFSLEAKEGYSSELDYYLQKLKYKTIRGKEIDNLELLRENFEKDRATGNVAESAKEKVERWNEEGIHIEDVDEVESHGVLGASFESEEPTHTTATSNSSKNKSKKRKVEERDALVGEIKEVKEAIEKVASAISSSNRRIRKEEDILAELMRLGLRGHDLAAAADIFGNDPVAANMLFAYPEDTRIEWVNAKLRG